MTFRHVWIHQVGALFGTDNNGKSLFDGVWFGARNSIIISFIATVINVGCRVIVMEFGDPNPSTVTWWKFITLFQTFHLCWSLSSWLTQWDLVSEFDFCHVLTRDGSPELLHDSCSNHALPWIWEYNLTSRTLGTPMQAENCCMKILLPQLVSVIVTQTSQMLPSFISFSFPFLLLRTWSSNHSSKFWDGWLTTQT